MPIIPRSNSPYSYNVPSRRAGQDPNKVPVNYQPSTKLYEEQFVVSEKQPPYCIHLESELIWDYDNECNSDFKSAKYTFKLQRTQRNIDYKTTTSISEYLIPNMEKTYKSMSPSNVSESYTWKGTRTFELTDEFKSDMLDMIILEDGIYVDYMMRYEDGKVTVELDHTPIHEVDASIFQFGEDVDDYSAFKWRTIDPTTFTLLPDGSIRCPNELNEFDIFPVIYGFDGTRRNVHPDISVHHLTFKKRRHSN